MAERRFYSLAALVAQCDPSAPMPEALRGWDQATPVGLEQVVMGAQVDIREAILTFSEHLALHYDASQCILFGSRARGDYQPDSDADVAVVLRGAPADFVETKLDMAGLAYDVLLDTGVRIQPFPTWETEWYQPEVCSNPTILRNIRREGIIIWRS